MVMEKLAISVPASEFRRSHDIGTLVGLLQNYAPA
jgi:hypothetical protein